MPSTAQVDLVGEIGGGDITAAWRGYLGTTSVVLKMNRFIEEHSENRAVLDEWRRLSARLPGDIKRATALPIPTYHGLFVREEADMILMSDCGDPLEAYLDDEQGEELSVAYEQALNALRDVGIEPEDVAPRNAVYDGHVVRIIDFV
ncbi:hypothetical protein BD414DRAFT_533925 [Trametes punicea]|nr:hypothetical protein BD414DRAFT_533925 [Trametes punicea]